MLQNRWHRPSSPVASKWTGLALPSALESCGCQPTSPGRPVHIQDTLDDTGFFGGKKDTYWDYVLIGATTNDRTS